MRSGLSVSGSSERLDNRSTVTAFETSSFGSHRNKSRLLRRKSHTKESGTESPQSNYALALTLLALVFAAMALGGGSQFRSKLLLDEQFAKHGREFGAITRHQYLLLAQQFRDARPGKDILQLRRTDGGISKFDRKRGYFGTYDADGTIRTFFVPAEGVRYFARQAVRNGTRERE